MSEPRTVLIIGGFDPSGGAGILADMDAIRDHGLLGLGAVAAVTAQNSKRFVRWRAVETPLLEDELAALSGDYRIAAIKIGMVGSEGNVRFVESFLEKNRRVPVVLDPVLVSSSGGALSRDAVTRGIARRLVPLATVVTPNAAEAMALSGTAAFGKRGIEAAAEALVKKLGAKVAVVTGGDMSEEEDSWRKSKRRGRGASGTGRVRDCLYAGSGPAQWLDGVRVEPPGGARSVRGTGCRFATAIAAGLALKRPMPVAVQEAKRYVGRLIANRAARVGKGAAQVVPPRPRGK